MTELRVIAGGKDTARAAQRRYARPFLRKWISAGQAFARGEGSIKFRPAHVDLMSKLTNYPSANEFYCFASQHTLGETMGVSERYARQLFADLRLAGLVRPKRRGLGKTTIWLFCIDGVPLAEAKSAGPDRHSGAALDRRSGAALDRRSGAALDRRSGAAKPYEAEPIEIETIEREPSSTTPSPPPVAELRAREAQRLADEVTAALSPAQHKSHRWKGLARWITAKLEQGCEVFDVSTGILQALDTLNGATPSSFSYFDKPIDRARASRLKPLPGPSVRFGQVGQASSVSRSRLVAYAAERLGVSMATLGTLGADWLTEQHRQFVDGEIGMPEIVAAARQRLDEIACDARATANAERVRAEINSYCDADGGNA